MFRSWFILLCVLSAVSGAPEQHREHGHYDKEGKHSEEHDHKVFLGNEQEKEFKEMTVEKSIEQLGKLVDKIDKNKDGNVTLEELTEWIKYISHKEPTENAKKHFVKSYSKKMGDDGLLSWEEFLETNFPGTHKTKESHQERIKEFHQKFKAADLSKDGNLDAEEFTAFLYPYLFRHMHDLVAGEVLKELDKDNDGKVTLQERLTESEDPEYQNGIKREFSIRDLNGDGFLDRDEIKEWYFPTSYDVNENEARHLINRADSNKDKVLSKQEILDKHDVFVGSKATQWGKTLKRSTDEL